MQIKGKGAADTAAARYSKLTKGMESIAGTLELVMNATRGMLNGENFFDTTGILTIAIDNDYISITASEKESKKRVIDVHRFYN